MSPVPPEDTPDSSLSDDHIHESYFDDEDTGPLYIVTPAQEPENDWDTGPELTTQSSTRAGRFDAPLTVTPRPVSARTPRNPNILLRVGGAVVGLALIGGLIFWLTRPSSDSSEAPTATPSTSVSAAPKAKDDDQAQLTKLLAHGYPPDTCEAASLPKGALAQVNCGPNADPGGPASATYTLASDKAALDDAFNAAVTTADRVNCPGNIQSPGPWRRNASPQVVSGTLFCGLREGQPTVVWTDDANLVINAVQSGLQGPTFPALYAWWSSHS